MSSRRWSTRLRPGADYSRAAAEEAFSASTQLIRAEQAEAVSRTVLARALGSAGGQFSPSAGRLLERRTRSRRLREIP